MGTAQIPDPTESVRHQLRPLFVQIVIKELDQGRVVAQGRHGELMGSGGLYARLARLQFSDDAAMAQ